MVKKMEVKICYNYDGFPKEAIIELDEEDVSIYGLNGDKEDADLEMLQIDVACAIADQISEEFSYNVGNFEYEWFTRINNGYSFIVSIY